VARPAGWSEVKVNINMKAALLAALPIAGLAGFLALVAFFPVAGSIVGGVGAASILFYFLFNIFKEQLTYSAAKKHLEEEGKESDARLRQVLEKLRNVTKERN
jgi:hypothetical protein